MSTAADRGWGAGWPSCGGAKGNIVTVILSNGTRLPVHRRIAPIVRALAEESIKRGYAARDGQSWGFACRPIRGTQTPSNHSWALAIDVNAPANPMQPTLKTDMPQWFTDLWKSHGFRWGGDYSGRKDAMHFEWMGTPAAADRMVADLLKSLPPAPPPAPIPLEDDMTMIHPRAGADKGAIFLHGGDKLIVMTQSMFDSFAGAGHKVVELNEGDWNRLKSAYTVVT